MTMKTFLFRMYCIVSLVLGLGAVIAYFTTVREIAQLCLLGLAWSLFGIFVNSALWEWVEDKVKFGNK